MRKNRYTINREILKSIYTRELNDRLFREKDLLMPYFKLENGRRVFLETLKILRNDKVSDYTVFVAKPGDFKTSKQLEKYGSLYSPFSGNEFNVIDYRTGTNNYDLFEIQMRELFYNEEMFLATFNFYKENYDKLKFNYLKV